jgi:eukaryotic-like serine/threonine-protein kinase
MKSALEAEPGRRDPVEQLAEAFMERYRRGERPPIEEFIAQAPEHADEIRELFPALILLDQAVPDEHPESVGPVTAGPLDRIGDYRIIREVGRGGMGIVYEAEQEALRRHVALKILPPNIAADSQSVLRFRREARSAARLHHTNIVPVFDIGEREGVHYYAMQFILGQSLNEVIRELRRLPGLSPKEKAAPSTPPPPLAADLAASMISGQFLASDPAVVASPSSEDAPSPASAAASTPAPARSLAEKSGSAHSLFDQSDSSSRSGAHLHRSIARIGQQAATALAYAHSQRVLHRDIKPANLLLDVAGTVWVTDFGLAKEEGDDLTHTGDVVGTLRYIAPERFSRRADPRSDIYSLGLTLYELLTLQPAFPETDRVRLVHAVTHREPEAPRRLDPRIPRDLETIVLKAITKEPNGRYARAEDLQDDLSRFLLDQPIQARRASGWERTWRWCRRNPMVASLAGALGLLMIGSVLSLSGLYIKADAQRQQAEIQQHRAEDAEETSAQAAAEARQGEAKAQEAALQTKAVLEFFQNKVLATPRPKNLEGGLGHDTTIREAMDRAEPTIAQTFAGQPLAEAAIRTTLGWTYLYLGDTPGAIKQHERALELRKPHLPPDDPELLDSRYSLAYDYYSAGRLPEALKFQQENLRLQTTRLGPDHPKTLGTMRNVAQILAAVGRSNEAISLYEENLRRSKKALGSDDQQTLFCMKALANAYHSTNRFAEAAPLYETAAALQKAKLGPDHVDTLETMQQLGVSYFDSGRLKEALAIWEDTLKRARVTWGPGRGSTLGLMNNVAAAYREMGQTAKAVPLFEEALNLQKAKLGPDHLTTLVSMANLAGAYREVGRLDEALALYQATLNRSKSKLGADHPTRLQIMNLTGHCLLKTKHFDQAARLLRECLALRERKDPTDWWIFHTKSQLGQSLIGLKNYPEAEALLLEAHEKLTERKEKIAKRYHAYLADADQALVDLYDAWGKKEQASTWRQKLPPGSSRR